MKRRTQAKKTTRKQYSKELNDETLALAEKLGMYSSDFFDPARQLWTPC